MDSLIIELVTLYKSIKGQVSERGQLYILVLELKPQERQGV